MTDSALENHRLEWPATRGRTSVTLHHGLAGLRALKMDWVRLTRTDRRYWISFAFFEESVVHSKAGEDGIVFVACRNGVGRVTAIVPIRMRTLPVRRIPFQCAELAGSSFDDVACQASSADFPAESTPDAEAALRAVVKMLKASPSKPSLLLLGRVTKDGNALPAALAVHGKPRAHAQVGGAKWIDVNRPFIELQRALSGKFRISLRSSKRNLRALGNLEFRATTRSDPHFANDFQEFLRIEASGWKGTEGTWTGLLVNPVQNQRAFLEAVAFRNDLAEAEVHSLRLNGTLIASQLWLRAGEARVAFKIGYREEFAKFQPGHLLTEHVLAESCADPELKVVDFVSDASWLDKWRVTVAHHYFHYLPVRPVHGMIASMLLTVPPLSDLREHVGNAMSSWIRRS